VQAAWLAEVRYAEKQGAVTNVTNVTALSKLVPVKNPMDSKACDIYNNNYRK
jgi:hypothetical protein